MSLNLGDVGLVEAEYDASDEQGTQRDPAAADDDRAQDQYVERVERDDHKYRERDEERERLRAHGDLGKEDGGHAKDDPEPNLPAQRRPFLDHQMP